MTPEGSALPESQGSATRERLLKAAAEIFNTDGYHRTNTNLIARAAGYAPATFYKHFPNKTAIFLAVYEEWVTVEWARIRDATAAARHLPLDELAKHVISAALDHHRRWRGFRSTLRALAETDPDVRTARLNQRRRQADLLADALAVLGRRCPATAATILLTFTVERLLDLVADGDLNELGIEEAEAVRLAETEVVRFLA